MATLLYVFSKGQWGFWVLWERFCISHPSLNLLFPFCLVWMGLDLGQERFYPVTNPAGSSSFHFPGNIFYSFGPKDLHYCPLVCILAARRGDLSPWPQAVSVAGSKREDGARSSAELSWAMQSSGDQDARLAFASKTQQSHGWGLALPVLRTAALLFFPTAQREVQSDDTPLPLCSLVVSWFGFLETASGTSQTVAERLDAVILWREAAFHTGAWPDYTWIRWPGWGRCWHRCLCFKCTSAALLISLHTQS